MPQSTKVLAVILGGGRGSRLYPLTKNRSKPAVPIGGKYRLIDIPISNCINSGIYKVAILTQFNSVSLHRHIVHTYNFDVFHTGWVQIWAAEQTMQNAGWYQGTADAVRKQIFEILSSHTENVLILAGDHLYRMDYAAMYDFHEKNNADITIAVQPIRKDDAGRFGILKRDPDYHITRFAEKPKDPDVLADLVSRDDPERPFLGSMGIYLFKTDVLVKLLQKYSHLDDFGGDIIPLAIKTHTVFGYDFDGYWEDIGTIRSFYDTNLRMCDPNPPFNFFDPVNPIYTHARFLPGSNIQNTRLDKAFVSEGCCIESAEVIHSVIGLRSQIRKGSVLRDTIMMGADYYGDSAEDYRESTLPLGIGENCQISGAILDKNVRIGNNVVIEPFTDVEDLDDELYVVRDGIVVIPKNTEIPAGTRISPQV